MPPFPSAQTALSVPALGGPIAGDLRRNLSAAVSQLLREIPSARTSCRRWLAAAGYVTVNGCWRRFTH